jgi:hypothetical protein
MNLKTCSIAIVLGVCLCLAACGRKQRNIFNFSEKNTIKINKLTLSTVKGVQVQKNKDSNLVKWLPLKTPMKLLGYNVYRLVRGSFASKKPLNKEPINQTFFTDTKPGKKYPNCYFVVPVFSEQNQVFEGPISQIICAQ